MPSPRGRWAYVGYLIINCIPILGILISILGPIFICLTNIYYLTVGHLIENLLKKSNAPHMPAPSLGLNIERTTVSQTLSELVV